MWLLTLETFQLHPRAGTGHTLIKAAEWQETAVGAPGSLHGPCLPSTLLLHPSLQKGWLLSEARLSLEDSQTPRRSSPPGVWEAQWQPASWWAFLGRDCSHLHHQELTAPHPALWMCAQGLLQSGWKEPQERQQGPGLGSSAGCTRL